MAYNQSIIHLNISSIAKESRHRNRILAKGLNYLSPLLAHNKFLQILNLAGNTIKNEGVKKLCKAIRESDNKTIDSLNLAMNDLQPQSCDHLAPLIQRGHLRILNLKHNTLGLQGIT
jgi:hypothetical protein